METNKMNIINKNGVKVNDQAIKKTLLIACDLIKHGYNFSYFYDNYTNLLNERDALKLWHIALTKLSVL
ncbi:hypothetical protein SD457_06520 [Coprobacillaceae bacterium CR2/5/TPMF4]|nr:hypothetical protein SD457_06520 [Coprobacillaceae bacterium CR2/5/TPMF4]